jgi:hypothetical protein
MNINLLIEKIEEIDTRHYNEWHEARYELISFIEEQKKHERKTMKNYILTSDDLEAINRIIQVGGNAVRITMDDADFEVGIMSSSGYSPVAYGSGQTLADAINEAIGTKENPYKLDFK